jgi:hypothetical protein
MKKITTLFLLLVFVFGAGNGFSRVEANSGDIDVTERVLLLNQIQELLKLISLLQIQLDQKLAESNSDSGSGLVSTIDEFVFEHELNSGETSYRKTGKIINKSDKLIRYRQSAVNQPPWLNVGYSTDEIPLQPNASAGISGYVEPGDLGVGTYETALVLTGNFSSSPLDIPIILNVVAENKESGEINISAPDVGDEWRIGDGEVFRWSDRNISSSKEGEIYLIGKAMFIKSKITDVKNSGSYFWNVGDRYSGYNIEPGEYFVLIVVNGYGDMVGPITISPPKDSKTINIDVDHDVTSQSNGYDNYELNISGGNSANPVQQWTLNFDCPSGVEVFAKVSGDVCGGEDYVIGSRSVTGAEDVTVTFVIDEDASSSQDLDIEIRAYGLDGSEMDETEYSIDL